MKFSYYSKKVVILLAALGWLGSAQIAHAGYITIDTKIEAKLYQGKLVVIAEITNNGDEPAYNLVCNATIGNTSLSGDTKPVLQVKEKFRNPFDLTNPFDKSGSYPVVVRIDFTDANQYPLSAISVTHVNYLENVSPQIFGKIDAVEVAKKGKVRVKVKNLEGNEKDLSARLIVPNEISTSAPVIKVKLDPNAEHILDFPIANFSATVGSNYSIFALIEYVQNAKHFSIAIPGSVKIVEKQKLTGTQVYVVIGVPLVLLIFYFLWLMTRKNKSSPQA